MPIYIWLKEPPVTVLLEGDEIKLDMLSRIVAEPDSFIVERTTKGKQFATRAGNILAMREVSHEEVQEAEAEAQQRAEAIARQGGRVTPANLMRIPGRGH